ncbi:MULTISPECIES: hemin uptake protein HemP [Actibacterium]|uniref:Hemin uptake protein HemP n=1 Tax=Actibacterium naphthalenivorans TaxID=1614693 RepID=A0A840CF63_9RHOB|nr:MULTISPECIES: hemin uptake protein HemP [Actibacterium]MBB4023453.1 hemin uptake protein HemP [Actibacterium naphthalenivorans]
MAADSVHNSPQARDGDLPCYRAEDLTRGGVQARIVLDEQVYTLRITRAGKLILTK